MTINKYMLKCVTLAAALVLAAGCAETRTEREFGDSVRSVMSKQIADPHAAALPSSEAITGGHAGRLEGVIEAHGTDVADSSGVNKPVSVDVGSNRR
jgi:type IV pilus biogenesis protein CpaD/CtpE